MKNIACKCLLTTVKHTVKKPRNINNFKLGLQPKAFDKQCGKKGIERTAWFQVTKEMAWKKKDKND